MTTVAGEARDKKAPLPFQVAAHSRATRGVCAALLVLAAVNVLYLGAALAGDFVNGTQSAPPVAVAVGLALFTGLPLLFVAALNRLVRGELSVGPNALVLTLRGERIEIPVGSVTCARPLQLPAPMPGVFLELGSGRRFERTLGTRDVPGLMRLLGPYVSHDMSAMVDHAGALPARRSRALFVFKHVALPLGLTVVIFRLHQIIVYGGPFGQFHSLGLGPYLASFFMRWLGIGGSFIVLAGVLRILIESSVYGLTRRWPVRAIGIRRAAEITGLVLYSGLIPGYVALRLLVD